MSVATDVNDSLERVNRTGVKSATLNDLLAIVLSPTPDRVALNECRATDLVRNNRVSGLAELDRSYLADEDLFTAQRILCALEIGRRVGSANVGGKRKVVEGPDDAVALFEHLRLAKKEHVAAAFFDSKNSVLGSETIHVGTLNSSIVGPREIFRAALKMGAASVVVAHNHPSGDPTPSPEDGLVTTKLIEVGELLDVRMHDHLVLGHHSYYSFTAGKVRSYPK